MRLSCTQQGMEAGLACSSRNQLLLSVAVYSAATAFSRTSLDAVQKPIRKWMWLMLSVTWESGSKNEPLRVDARANRSSAGAVSLGEGWWFYVLQTSQRRSGLERAMYRMNVWRESSLPKFMVQDPSCGNICVH